MLNPGTPRAQRKCRQIMDGAARIFDEQGFEEASVDMIAEAADVSKATLYKYFANKQELFKAILQLQCKVYSERIAKLSKVDGTLEDNLRVIASTIGQTFTSPHLANLFRLTIAETTRFPEIGRAFYESGPKAGETLIAAILQKQIDTGELAIDDTPAPRPSFWNSSKLTSSTSASSASAQISPRRTSTRARKMRCRRFCGLIECSEVEWRGGTPTQARINLRRRNDTHLIASLNLRHISLRGAVDFFFGVEMQIQFR